MKHTNLLVSFLVCMTCSAVNGIAADAAKTQELMSVLKSNATFYEKARACQQLGEIGTVEAVPVLAGLLGNEQLNAYARSGLEGIGGKEATTALIRALNEVPDAQRFGAIDSLGILQNSNAVPVLIQMVDGTNIVLASAALKSLGCIPTPESLTCLQASLGKTALKIPAAIGCLQAAEQVAAKGDSDSAVKLFESVQKSDLPASFRIAAVRGRCLALKSDAPRYLTTQLRSGDSAMQLAALTTIRELPDDAMASALNEVYPKLEVAMQRQLLLAFGDCHNKGSLDILRQAVLAENAELRQAALLVIGRIGGKTEAETLCLLLQKNGEGTEKSQAQNALQQMEGKEVDSVLIRQLAASQTSELKIAVIHILANRKAVDANPALQNEAMLKENVEVAMAALGALGGMAEVTDLDGLLAVAVSDRGDAVRKEAQTALANACVRLGEPACKLMLTEIEKSGDLSRRLTAARVLTLISYRPALPALRLLAMKEGDSVGGNVIQALGLWQDTKPVEMLLSMDTGEFGMERTRQARLSAVRLVAAGLDEHQRSETEAITWLKKAAVLNDAEVQKAVIQVLGQIKASSSFHALVELSVATQNREAYATAILQMAPALLKSEVASELKKQLLQISTEFKGETANTALNLAGKIQ